MNKDNKMGTEGSNPNRADDQQVKRQPDKETKEQNQQLTKDELPDSTNESRGNTGSGQRQDSN